MDARSTEGVRMSRGQAHLPDPTTSAGDTATLGSTDDLLSKLAGDEIDKLLAEAEVERPPEPAATAPAQKTDASPASVDDDLSSQIDQILSDRQAPAPVAADVPAVPAAVAPVATTDPAEEARLKKLAEELEVDQTASAPMNTETAQEED